MLVLFNCVTQILFVFTAIILFSLTLSLSPHQNILVTHVPVYCNLFLHLMHLNGINTRWSLKYNCPPNITDGGDTEGLMICWLNCIKKNHNFLKLHFDYMYILCINPWYVQWYIISTKLTVVLWENKVFCLRSVFVSIDCQWFLSSYVLCVCMIFDVFVFTHEIE